MDLWPEQTGNVETCTFRSCVPEGWSHLLFLKGLSCPDAAVAVWSDDRVYRKRKQQLPHTAASVPKAVITAGVQLLQGIHWYLLVTSISWCSLQLQMPVSLLSSWNTQTLWGECRAVWEVMDLNSLCQSSIWTTLHPVWQSWPDLVSLVDVTGSACEGNNKRATNSGSIMTLFNFTYLFLLSV